MPWCPNCKNEYKEGITVCADCGTTLVESLDEGKKPLYFGTEEALANMADFLEANHIRRPEIRYDETEELYELYVDGKDLEVSKKALSVYLRQVSGCEEKEEINEIAEDDCMPEKETGCYEDLAKKAEDYRTGANTLLGVGALGLVALIFLNVGIIPISLTGYTKVLINVVMGFLFALFVVLGILSRKTYKQLKKQSVQENDRKQELQEWLEKQVKTETFLQEMNDSSLTQEEAYFKRTDRLKSMLREYDDTLSENFIEYVIEECYPLLFEQS